VKSRRATVAGPEVMYKSMIICLAADICEQLKRNLKFDLLKAEFIGDPEPTASSRARCANRGAYNGRLRNFSEC